MGERNAYGEGTGGGNGRGTDLELRKSYNPQHTKQEKMQLTVVLLQQIAVKFTLRPAFVGG